MSVLKNAYDPFFIISINDKPIPEDISKKIQSFEYEDNSEKDDMLTIIVENNDLALTDDERFAVGGIIKYRFGYSDRISDYMTAKIQDIEGLTDIKVAAYQTSSAKTAISSPAVAVKNTLVNTENKTYTVKKGDNLTKIGKMFNMDWKTIYNSNKEKIGNNPNLIYPGQIFSIPGEVEQKQEAQQPQVTTNAAINSQDDNNVLGKKTRVWKKMKYSDIAIAIAKEMGLIANVTITQQKYDTVPQTNEDNMEFLKRIGKLINFLPRITGGVLNFEPKDFSSKSHYTLIYFIDGAGELEKFNPKIKTKKAASSATSTGLDLTTKMPTADLSKESKTNKLGKYSYQIDGITGEEKRILTPDGLNSSDKIGGKNSDISPAESALAGDEDGGITAECDCIGIPEIKSAGIITVLGVGKKWSGNWYVKVVKHNIDSSGYKTKLELSRNALGQAAPDAATVNSKINDTKANDKNKINDNSIIVDGIDGSETTVKEYNSTHKTKVGVK